MRKSIFIMAIAALLFAGCDNNKSNKHSHDGEGSQENTEGTHQHEDGSMHQDHHDAEHSQEEFKVESDSTSKKVEEQGHNHKDGSHQH